MKLDKKQLIADVAKTYEKLLLEKLGSRLKSLYLVGSYAFGRISLDRPDINFLIILNGYPVADDYIELGRISREIVNRFQQKCRIILEYRPFRYIYPKTKNGYDIFINPIIISTGEIKNRGFIFTKCFTEGMKNGNKLLWGEDTLSSIKIKEITKRDVFEGALFDIPFFTIPLTRAPAQYDENEFDLLFNEALTNAKMLCYMGIELVMTDEELRKRDYVKYIQNKETIVDFYKEKYGDDVARLVDKVFLGRENYLEYKDDKGKATEMFSVALQISGILQNRLFSVKQ